MTTIIILDILAVLTVVLTGITVTNNDASLNSKVLKSSALLGSFMLLTVLLI